MPSPSPHNAEEISGVLHRINLLGAATEQLFSRLYVGLNRRNEKEDREQRRAELEEKIAQSQRVSEQNRQLQISLAMRLGEIERLEGILSGLDEGIIMQDNEGQVVYINKAARDLIGTQKISGKRS